MQFQIEARSVPTHKKLKDPTDPKSKIGDIIQCQMGIQNDVVSRGVFPNLARIGTFTTVAIS